ncbi:cytochrome P450 [Spongiactinospora rosea]|uniref:Cytochrome P450 n=1 Tax=Spongiactinospora rosea TaxID=2248750 RepID=A0A366M4W6_9ACTN|nr:cytochrome P450 [Spongiactinospora rosea]RBQ21298.1 cytochrome P450 [Spongiactinospora rosea]
MPENSIPGPGPGADLAPVGGLHEYQLRLHAEYGPVARFRLPGGLPAVSVADPVLLEATAHIDKRPEKPFEFLAPLCEAGNLQTLPADEHTPWRKVLLSVLAGRRSHQARFARFTELATGLADRWAAHDGPVASQKDLSALSLRMICDYALGGLDDPGTADRVVSAFQAVLEGDAGQALAYLRSVVDDILNGDQGDLIGALAAAGMSAARIRDTVLVIMLAAHHTTGVAVSWTLHLLARHPEVAARVTAEVDDVLGDRPAPAYADLRRLTYLEMALKESMRLYPPGPYGAREATHDLTLGDHHIPAGTTIFYPFWAIHLNPQYWPDPQAFVPERFTPEAIAARPRHAFVPFGLGPRACEGSGLAMVEAELVLAVLLKRLEFAPVAGHPVVPVERFVLWAADDILMEVRHR